MLTKHSLMYNRGLDEVIVILESSQPDRVKYKKVAVLVGVLEVVNKMFTGKVKR